MKIKNQNGQISAELILIFGAVIIIVLLMMNMYHDYIRDMNTQIEENELNNLLGKIDNLNNKIK